MLYKRMQSSGVSAPSPLGEGKGRRAFLVFFLFFSLSGFAQQWLKFNRHYDGAKFSIPVSSDVLQYNDYSKSGKNIQMHYLDADGMDRIVPFSLSYLDSISVVPSITDEEKGHNYARVFTMNITTVDGQTIDNREDWIDCFISIDGKGEYSNYSGPARIKGRGNSSWLWWDKKPYKFKLDTKSKILGLAKAKNWNLLSNMRDITKLMNTHAFEVARYMGMDPTCHSRNLEVFLNGEYIGLYELTEKIEVGKNRVNIDEDGGVLLSVDADDGPNLSPDATNNFWSKVYYLPMSVKYPEDISADSLELIRDEFASLEHAIQTHDYDLVESKMDIASFISLLQMHEYLYNVEIDAPRSIYLYRDKNGKYTWGPVWDWDAGYDFDWSDMYSGHTYFSSYKELILGTDPHNNIGANYSINNFWRDMFQSKKFVTQYKDTWTSIADSLFIKPWAETEKYYNGMVADGYDRDTKKWPNFSYYTWGSFEPTTEVGKMKKWLQKRLDYLTPIIAAYPEGADEVVSKYEVCGTITKTVNCNYDNGYSQNGTITLSPSEVGRLLGGTPTSLVPLNSDGSDGTNTAAGTYGAWFDADGNTAAFSSGTVHVYLESDEMWNWNYGLEQKTCARGDKHTVTMQFRLDNKAVNVNVRFLVDTTEEGDDDPDSDKIVNGTISKTVTCIFDCGYDQDNTIDIDEDVVKEYLGGTPTSLIALNSDGSEGSNTAAGYYGAWFGSNGDTAPWSVAHVYIESFDLWSWDYGCHPDNCQEGDVHTVTMQYKLGHKTLNVKVTFNVITPLIY